MTYVTKLAGRLPEKSKSSYFLLLMALPLYDNIKNTNRKKINVTSAAAENCGNIVITSI